MNAKLFTLPALLAAAALAACGGSDTAKTAKSAAPAGGATRVEVKTFIFRPTKLTVARGTTVTWTNADQADHTVTSGTRADPDTAGKPDGRFAGPLKASGGSYTHKFTTAGVYRYFCALHNGTGMTGEVVVR